MASIGDALEESITERAAFIKYIIYAIPVYFSYTLYNSKDKLLFYIVAGITAIMLLTILKHTIYNVRNGKENILPSFNPISFIIEALQLITAMGPIIAIFGTIGFLLSMIQIPIPVDNVQMIYLIIVWGLLGGIMLTSLLCYSRTEKMKDAYNFKIISKSSIDVLIAFFFFLVQLAVVDAIVVGIMTYMFNVLWNIENPVYIFLCCIIFSSNIAIMGNYMAQVDYEVIPHEEENAKEPTDNF